MSKVDPARVEMLDHELWVRVAKLCDKWQMDSLPSTTPAGERRVFAQCRRELLRELARKPVAK